MKDLTVYFAQISAEGKDSEFIGFIKGNIIKYSIRGGHKEGESPEKDLTKVNTYHRWLRLAEQGQMINPMID